MNSGTMNAQLELWRLFPSGEGILRQATSAGDLSRREAAAAQALLLLNPARLRVACTHRAVAGKRYLFLFFDQRTIRNKKN